MDKRLRYPRVLLVLITLLFSLDCIAQLPAFTLDVTPTAQTCLGNGSLAFTVTGNNPAASMDYAVYLLPNTTTPVVIATTPTVGGLVAGNYMVVATQSLGGQSNTATDNVTIGNNIVPLDYTLTPTPVRCGSDGVITVNITSGVGALYEITSGPVTVAPQASNVFNNLPVGTYQVRVYDNCGEADVTALVLTQTNTGLGISPTISSGGELPGCDAITIKHDISTTSSGYQIFYPLTIQFTIFPPGGGAPVVVTQTINGGGANGVTVNSDILFYYGQQYTYNLKITDACGNIYNRNGNVMNKTLAVSVEQEVANCGDHAFKVIPSNYVGPYTINFTTAPAGFNPVAFNPGHPTFNLDEVPYGDVNSNSVPEGVYILELTDACGHTVTKEFEVEPPEVEPQIMPEVEGCSAEGKVTIEMPGRAVVSVVITAAPAEYPDPLDDDVSEFITNGKLIMDGLPIGHYEVTITDSCGEIFEEEFDLEPPTVSVSVSQNPGCEIGMGSIRITADGASITIVQIMDAPDAFTGPFPLNVSANIVAANGRFYMNSLPEGPYVFRVVDACGGMRDLPVVVEGYHTQTNTIDITPDCNMFGLFLQHVSTGNNLQSFWLQRLDETTGNWEHPITGADYTNNATPNSNNSYLLSNNFNNINIQSTGHFRILKLHYIWGNGSASNFRCLEVIEEFDFDGAPVITDAYSFPCAGGLTEVVVVAEGVPPLSYKITTKNNQPFVIDNGISNIFSGLEPATYNFQVSDICGNIRNIQFDINALDPIEIVAEGFCEGEPSSLSVAEFSFLTYEWWEAGDPDTILSTTGTLSFPAYNSATDAGTYIVSIASPQVGSCISQVLEYEIEANDIPVAGQDNSVAVCNDNETIDLEDYLSSTHDSGGTWEDVDATGALTGGMLNTSGIADGTYHFRYTVTGFCDLEDEALITLELKNRPAAPVIDPVAPVCEGDNIQFSATAVPGATYQWSGPGNFASTELNPLLQNVTVAQGGTYLLTATVNGCASPQSTVTVTVNTLPRAGNDNNLSFCNDGQALNLADYLSVPHDIGGTWEDVNATGALTGSSLNTATIAAGTYQFKYKVAGCNQEDEAVITIELKARPTAPAIAPVAAVCEGNGMQFLVTPVPGATYQWTGPNNFTSTEQNPSLFNTTLANSGTYSLVVTVNGCASPTATVAVAIDPIPQFTIGGTPSFCEGQSTVLSIEPGNFPVTEAGYIWYHDGQLLTDVDENTIEVFETGDYTVEVNRNGCVASEGIAVTQSTGMFTVELDAGCRNTEYVITVVNRDDLEDPSFVWTGPENYYHVGEEAVITDLPAGEYFVTVTNAEGCSEDASIVVDNTSCFIPRGISPNGDDYNNSFDLSNLDVQHIKIFNRYGLEVYEKDNYLNEWHGQSHRGELPTGTYFYVLTLSAGKKVTGWVYLQRQVN